MVLKIIIIGIIVVFSAFQIKGLICDIKKHRKNKKDLDSVKENKEKEVN